MIPIEPKSILFEQSDAELMPLKSYVDSFIENSENPLFQLPPIQRNSVWNVAQIERLWDSILRGFPIGSFLVAPMEKGVTARNILTGKQMDSLKEGYYLLDGQQRTRGLLLGFAPGDNARLWIDLNPKLNSTSDINANDRKFLFRVLTNYQPWGMDDRNPTDKLSESEKGPAREKYFGKREHYDYEVKLNLDVDGNEDADESWPIKSNLAVPFDLLVKLCLDRDKNFIKPKWDEVLNLVPKEFKTDENQFAEPTHFQEIIDGIENLISQNLKNGQKRRMIVLLRQENCPEKPAPHEQDVMEVLFRRVNSGGTPLQGEEMAYSLLKSSWPDVYGCVYDVVKDPEIGHLMSPTKIVMASARLARFNLNKSDNANFSTNQFRRWVSENDEDGLLQELKNLLIVNNELRKSTLHGVLHVFCNTVQYSIDNPLGIPKKLLLTMNSNSYLPVLAWILKNSHQEIDLDNKKAILRYLFYSYIALDKQGIASSIAMKTIQNTNTTTFPDFQIYQNIVGEERGFKLPTTQEFNEPFEINKFPFKDHHEAFGIDGFEDFRIRFWKDRLPLLIWFQRDLFNTWFSGYNPSSDDNFDTPYDWDHVLPYSHIVGQGNWSYNDLADDEIKRLDNNRYRYINSIGNFRIWPFWTNRKDGNVCHTKKLRMDVIDLENDEIAQELNLKSQTDFLIASKIPLEDQILWLQSKGSPRTWQKDRMGNWSKAVENRVCKFYKEFYEVLDFNSWEN